MDWENCINANYCICKIPAPPSHFQTSCSHSLHPKGIISTTISPPCLRGRGDVVISHPQTSHVPVKKENEWKDRLTHTTHNCTETWKRGRKRERGRERTWKRKRKKKKRKRRELKRKGINRGRAERRRKSKGRGGMIESLVLNRGIWSSLSLEILIGVNL